MRVLLLVDVAVSQQRVGPLTFVRFTVELVKSGEHTENF